jgi:hypothetical protein
VPLPDPIIDVCADALAAHNISAANASAEKIFIMVCFSCNSGITDDQISKGGRALKIPPGYYLPDFLGIMMTILRYLPL